MISLPSGLIARHLKETGITAPRTMRLNNVQLTAGPTAHPLSATLVDFGHYTVEAGYQDHDLVTLVSDRPFNWGTFVKEHDNNWPNPTPATFLDVAMMGHQELPDDLSKQLAFSYHTPLTHPGAEVEALRLALEIRDGVLAFADVSDALDEFVSKATPIKEKNALTKRQSCNPVLNTPHDF